MRQNYTVYVGLYKDLPNWTTMDPMVLKSVKIIFLCNHLVSMRHNIAGIFREGLIFSVN